MTVNAQGQSNQVVNARPVNGGTVEPTVAQLLAHIKELETAQASAITFKCRGEGETYTDGSGKVQTGKGAMSMYGLGRFPVTLYESQWNQVIRAVENGQVQAALASFKGKLAHKG